MLNKVISKVSFIRNKKLVLAIPRNSVMNSVSKKNFFAIRNISNCSQNKIDHKEMSFNSFNKLTKFSMSTNLPSHRKLFMPNLSPTMTKGNIVEWTKKEGDAIKPGDVIASVETDKAVVDFEVNEEGFLAKILYPAGSKDVNLGTVISKIQLILYIKLVGILVEDKNDVAAFANYKDESQAPAPVKPQEKKPEIKVEATAQKTETQTVSKPPVAEQKSQQKAPSTPAPSIPVSPSAQYEDIELTNVRKIIAERLLFSKTNIPHFYLGIECNVDKLLALRTRLNKHSAVKISINDMIIKAASLACIKVPEANSSWQVNSIKKYKNVDMSVAVQTDFGLITPIVTNSNLKGLAEISKEVKDLAERAKQQKLKPAEFQGGTFTISNLGMMGITNFSAIINPPQACILAVGKSEKRVILDENSTNKEMPYKVVNMMCATLSCDHRVVDGAVGAKWVQEFKDLLENPELMLL